MQDNPSGLPPRAGRVHDAWSLLEENLISGLFLVLYRRKETAPEEAYGTLTST
jgi:hypothetical protein